MECTWKGCDKEAVQPKLDRDGNQWADLCEDHHGELEKAIGAEPKRMLSAWVKAMGGAKIAAGRMNGKTLEEVYGSKA